MIRITLAAALFAAGLQAASAAEVRVLTTGAFRPVVAAVARDLGGDTLVIDNDTAGGVLRRIRDGAGFDVVVLTHAAIAELSASGNVAAGSGTDLARVGVGLAVRAGAPHPDISTVDALRRTLLDAASVAYIDPKAGGSSGIYVAGLLQRLGIAEQVGRKAVLVQGGLVADHVANGEAEIGIQQISELLHAGGVDVVGPLPAPVQNETVYAGGVAANAGDPVAAGRVLKALAAAGAARVAHGMLPP